MRRKQRDSQRLSEANYYFIGFFMDVICSDGERFALLLQPYAALNSVISKFDCVRFRCLHEPSRRLRVLADIERK